MSQSQKELARRYAKALFELACEEKALTQVEKDIIKIDKIFSLSEDLRKTVANPLVSRADHSKLILSILEKAKAHTVTKKCLAIIAQNRRLSHLPQIAEEFNILLCDYNGEIIAELTSANALTDKQVKKIEKELSASLNKKIKIKTKVDKEILGGLIIKLGSLMLDNSLSSKIERLEIITKNAVTII